MRDLRYADARAAVLVVQHAAPVVGCVLLLDAAGLAPARLRLRPGRGGRRGGRSGAAVPGMRDAAGGDGAVLRGVPLQLPDALGHHLRTAGPAHHTDRAGPAALPALRLPAVAAVPGEPARGAAAVGIGDGDLGLGGLPAGPAEFGDRGAGRTRHLIRRYGPPGRSPHGQRVAGGDRRGPGVLHRGHGPQRPRRERAVLPRLLARVRAAADRQPDHHRPTAAQHGRVARHRPVALPRGPGRLAQARGAGPAARRLLVGGRPGLHQRHHRQPRRGPDPRVHPDPARRGRPGARRRLDDHHHPPDLTAARSAGRGRHRPGVGAVRGVQPDPLATAVHAQPEAGARRVPVRQPGLAAHAGRPDAGAEAAQRHEVGGPGQEVPLGPARPEHGQQHEARREGRQDPRPRPALLGPAGRHRRQLAGGHHPVVGRTLRVPERPVAGDDGDRQGLRGAVRGQVRAGRRRDRRVQVHGRHRARTAEPVRDQRRVVAGARADLQHPLALPDAERLAHQRHQRRLAAGGDQFAARDMGGDRLVAVGTGQPAQPPPRVGVVRRVPPVPGFARLPAVVHRHEQVPRHLFEGRPPCRVLQPAARDDAPHHPVPQRLCRGPETLVLNRPGHAFILRPRQGSYDPGPPPGRLRPWWGD
ncbi:hypothetical protein SBRY_20255 [Actinacidiphila bryophytorum]|uniref:Uncharacterized protein n=1 Tax=Actinacidiphila bryophytorum TaxID=1436133 RepID=A0A9W4EDB7_9ACTN|nr:hypothetical protein SBRY_20255 [Actinacidiphila bryophytorum]